MELENDTLLGLIEEKLEGGTEPDKIGFLPLLKLI